MRYMIQVRLLDNNNATKDSYFLAQLKDFRYPNLSHLVFAFFDDLTQEKLDEYLETQGKYLLKKFLKTKGKISIDLWNVETGLFVLSSKIKEF